ncbi:MAG: hypothetical protein MK078_09755 [Crocinitomicaceae bacterium]|nr:hypothetical protein [Crocinitomicaceae bacterium]
MKKLLSILFISGSTLLAQHSHFTKNDHWRTQNKEFILGIGTSNLLGDLGGRDRLGKINSLADLETSLFRPAGHFGFRFRLLPFLSTTSMFQYGWLEGDDDLTNIPNRRYRNINTRTHLFEFTQRVELLLYCKENFGKRFKRPGLKGLRAKNDALYLFSGISVFGFIPQGKYEGTWRNLRPLNTEGQGLAGAPDPYKEYSFGIPIGIGYKVGLNGYWRMSFEISLTKTFTDYLDDVSGVYYDNNQIEQAYGTAAAYFADPSNGAFREWTEPGKSRGNPDQMDAYTFINISLIRNIVYKKRDY